MKRIIVLLLLICALLLVGCSTPGATSTPTTTPSTTIATSTGSPTQTTTSTTTTTPASTSPTPSASTPAGEKPVYGGTLKIIRPVLPKVIGLPSEFAPVDSIGALPALERLCEWDAQRNNIPVLAASWDVDTKAFTLTWHLQQGVKFSDGTDFNAEAVRWNFQQGIDSKSLTGSAFIKSMDVLDPYTLRMNLTTYTTMMMENYGWRQMISPTAFNNAGGGDIEKSKVWARANSVGTGPFKVTQFQRDVLIKYEKNPNYWRTDAWGGKMPYLDAIEVRLIPDTMTASATMEAKQADMWTEVTAVQNILDLTGKGLKTNWGPGGFYVLLPNSSDANSPVSKKEVREAIEYAINRPALANMLGLGKYKPLTQLAPPGFPAYVPGYDPRPYNPEKAKQLLAAAGYPAGFKIKIMAMAPDQDAVMGIKSYLGAVGIDASIDIADAGRYMGESFTTGFKDDLVWASAGSSGSLFVHFGPTPMTYKTGNIYKTPEYLALADKALHTYDHDAYITALHDTVKQAGEDAMVIPVYHAVNNAIMQSYVHSDYFVIDATQWTSQDDWMEKH